MHLDAEVASVNVVPQEEIPRSSGIATDFKEFHQVVLVINKFRMCVQEVLKLGRDSRIDHGCHRKLRPGWQGVKYVYQVDGT